MDRLPVASGFSAIQNNSGLSQGLSLRLAAPYSTKVASILIARCQMQKLSSVGKFHFEPPFTSFDHRVGGYLQALWRCSRLGRGLVSGLKLGNGKGNVRVLVGGG
jgi:hypothetical protein